MLLSKSLKKIKEKKNESLKNKKKVDESLTKESVEFNQDGEYVCGLNGKFYRLGGGKYIPVSKKVYLAYLRKNKLKFRDIQKLLTSVYPTQDKNYNLLKIPTQYVPVDYKLTNIVKLFWNHGITTQGWDQGLFNTRKNIDHPGFISFDRYNNQQEEVFVILKKLFGSRNIIDVSKSYQGVKPGKEMRDMKQKMSAKYPKQIRFDQSNYYCAISFNHQLLEWMHKKLKLKVPKIEDSKPGNSTIIQIMEIDTHYTDRNLHP